MTNWQRYLELMETRPELFKDGPLHIITDKTTINTFEKKSGRQIGVLYESPWRLVLVDLVKNDKENLFAYERVVSVNTGAVAVLPIYDGQVALIRQFRHPGRFTLPEIPRGFGKNGIPAEKNATRELFEEAGVTSADFTRLGQIMPDSGLTADEVDIFLAEIHKADFSIRHQEQTETISEIHLFTMPEIEKMVLNGTITDSFTLTALYLYSLRTNQATAPQ